MSPAVASVPLYAANRRWSIVIAAFCCVMFGFGSLLVFTFDVFIKPLRAEFGWSRETISGAFGFGATSVAVASPFLGRLLDRLPPRLFQLGLKVIF